MPDAPFFRERPILGDRIEVFTPSKANIFAGYTIVALCLIVVVLCVGGAVVGIHPGGRPPATKQDDNFNRFLLLMVAFGAGVFGFCVGWFTLTLRGIRIDWHVDGFRYSHASSNIVVSWSDISRVTELIFYERPPILHEPVGFLIPKLASRSFSVKLKNGMTVGVDGNSVKRLNRFGKLLRAVAEKHSLPWEVVEHGK